MKAVRFTRHGKPGVLTVEDVADPVRGRLVEMSVTGTREVTFNLADFYHNESRLIGIDTLKLNLTESAKLLEAVRTGFEDGDYRPAHISQHFPLAEAVAAYQSVANSELGRVVLQPNG